VGVDRRVDPDQFGELSSHAAFRVHWIFLLSDRTT
jgi:hypothetical protein